MAILKDFYGHQRTMFPISEILILGVNNNKDRKKYDNDAIIQQILSYDKSNITQFKQY